MKLEKCMNEIQKKIKESLHCMKIIGKFDEGNAMYYKGRAEALEEALEMLKKVEDITL